MLVEMRDAVGSNGEFYTLRPVIRFIVEQIKSDLEKSEKVLDPVCGTGGFLIESLEFMKKKEEVIIIGISVIVSSILYISYVTSR